MHKLSLALLKHSPDSAVPPTLAQSSRNKKVRTQNQFASDGQRYCSPVNFQQDLRLALCIVENKAGTLRRTC